jgi:hypothetical protein
MGDGREPSLRALVTMSHQLDEIVTVKGHTGRADVVAAWNTIVQTQRDLWLAEMQAAVEAAKIRMKQQGKVDAAVIASMNAQIAAQLNFINSVFGTGGGMLAEWKLDYNQRMAGMANLDKNMAVIFKQLTTDMDQVHQSLKDALAAFDRSETSPTTAEGLAKSMEALRTRMERVARVVDIRQKVVESYLKASAYSELKKKLEPILNLITPEQVAQDPNLSSLPAEVIQTLQNWKTLLPKKCEDTYGPVWDSAKKAGEWVTDHKRLWQSFPLFRESSTFDDIANLVSRAKAAAKEKLDAIKARWKLADAIKDAKKRALEERRAVRPQPSPGTREYLVSLAGSLMMAADKVVRDHPGSQKAMELRREAELLVRENAALLQRLADAYCSADGREYDELIAKCAQAQDSPAAAAIWGDFIAKRTTKIVETQQFIRENTDDMLKLKDVYDDVYGKPPAAVPFPSSPPTETPPWLR